MVEESTQEWFLNIDGKRTGPFTRDQLLGLLADQELPESQEIFSSATAAESITLRELADGKTIVAEMTDVALGSAPASELQMPAAQTPEIAATSAKPFIPPPRPNNLQPGNEPEREPTAFTMKPELGLLDALLAAKERKGVSTRPMPSDVKEDAPNPFSLENVPARFWTLAGTAALLMVAVWGLTHFIKQHAPPAPLAASSHSDAKDVSAPQAAPPAAPPPPAAISKPAPPPPAVAVNTPPAITPPPSMPGRPGSFSSMNRGGPPSMGMARDSEREREREREAEREKEKDREHEREIAANGDASSQPPPPPPPPAAETPPPPLSGPAGTDSAPAVNELPPVPAPPPVE